jgi:hypothetical protein
MADERVIYLPIGSRVAMSVISFAGYVVASLVVALPVSIRWNELHAAQISSTGTGGGTTAWFWGFYAIMLLWPMVGLLFLSSSLGSYPGDNGTKRLIGLKGGRARWWQCVVHALATWAVLTAGWFSAGWWGLLGAGILVTLWPWCNRKHRSLSDVLSFSALVMSVTSGPMNDAFPKAVPFSGDVKIVNTKTRVWWAVGVYVVVFVGALILSFIMMSH